jgi:hypothetical protein
VARGRLRKTRILRQARRALVWGATFFVAMQLAAIALLEWKQPEFYDPKYGCRLSALRARLSHEQGAPLVVILGTSRAEQGFRPGLLPVLPGQKTPVVFNLARGGSSPLLNLLTLQRLLADGIHPDWVLLEIFPPYLVAEKSGVTIAKATLRDLPALARYPVSWKTYAYSMRDRLLFWSKYRTGILGLCAPACTLVSGCWPECLWDARGGEWSAIGEGATLQESRDLTADAHRRYFRKLQGFHIASSADRALREILDLCRNQGINVLLFLMPEATEFRAWYAAASQQRLSTYLAGLQRQYGIPLVDARFWIPDSNFYDSHHLLRNGATVFTQQFATEIFPRVLSSDKNRDAVNRGHRLRRMNAQRREF